MVDVKGGNNILYLPLDRMTDNQMRSNNTPSSIIGNTNRPEDVNQTFEERRNRNPR